MTFQKGDQMRLCIFVTGTTGSGKTFFVRSLKYLGWQTLHTGDVFRKRHTPSLTGDLVAPAEADATIRHELHSFFSATRQQTQLLAAVECVPRTQEQVNWITQMGGTYDFLPIVFIFNADERVRIARVRSRGMSSEGRDIERDLMKLRQESVSHFMANLIMPITTHPALPFAIRCVDTTENDQTDITTGDKNTQVLDYLMQIVYAHFMERRSQKGEDLKMSPLGLIQRAREELAELEDAYTEMTRPGSIQEEWVDVMWFMLLIARDLGMTGDDIHKRFVAKAMVNDYRLDRHAKPSTEL